MHVRFPGRPSIAARTFPSADTTFAAEVAQALEDGRREVDDADALRAVVTRRLQSAYPDARVVPQSPMASVIDSEDVWYVYRDGRPPGAPAPARVPAGPVDTGDNPPSR